MRIVLFEDSRVAELYPVTIGKPAYTIGCGSCRLFDLVRDLGEQVHARVRPHLAAFRQAEPPLSHPGERHASATAYINARLVPSIDVANSLRRLLASGQPGFIAASEEFRPEADLGRPPTLADVAAAIVPAGAPAPAAGADFAALETWWQSLELEALRELKLPLFDYPHDIIRHHLRILSQNLDHRLTA
ncbi:MAG TPA: putative sugar nucleotidyl transferase, partial [Pirellulales bacterium]|nr:putative sugar nucleotidyl transferase [Pirellulales bacterium]